MTSADSPNLAQGGNLAAEVCIIFLCHAKLHYLCKINGTDPAWAIRALQSGVCFFVCVYHSMLGMISQRTSWFNANSLQPEVGRHKSRRGCDLTPNFAPEAE